ncbi:uncharacterized protein MYCFIDRAFT_175959 [Pseudocercospora fijiensis CIRAD86]|uniref:Uncharacterized protein n=1 Tax=Pseudocercospora fijiensis (strain CIRAD86) TaxID=383855 RepID=M3AYY5_PSEFD|nr:uncharacterized protein MYCFIDRAFT_175959 [Pseudocercospora fijiensis CIRAD86]EME82417.1 hypothetical protein MYCFIDRAFT_175959 [Pseudocercospora fijiensis CIRAD86]
MKQNRADMTCGSGRSWTIFVTKPQLAVALSSSYRTLWPATNHTAIMNVWCLAQDGPYAAAMTQLDMGMHELTSGRSSLGTAYYVRSLSARSSPAAFQNETSLYFRKPHRYRAQRDKTLRVCNNSWAGTAEYRQPTCRSNWLNTSPAWTLSFLMGPFHHVEEKQSTGVDSCRRRDSSAYDYRQVASLSLHWIAIPVMLGLRSVKNYQKVAPSAPSESQASSCKTTSLSNSPHFRDAERFISPAYAHDRFSPALVDNHQRSWRRCERQRNSVTRAEIFPVMAIAGVMVSLSIALPYERAWTEQPFLLAPTAILIQHIRRPLTVTIMADDANFLSLPVEVRLHVYSYLFQNEWIYINPRTETSPLRQQHDPGQCIAPLLYTCQQIREEASQIYFSNLKIFLDIHTFNSNGLREWLQHIGETNVRHLRHFNVRWNNYVDISIDLAQQKHGQETADVDLQSKRQRQHCHDEHQQCLTPRKTRRLYSRHAPTSAPRNPPPQLPIGAPSHTTTTNQQSFPYLPYQPTHDPLTKQLSFHRPITRLPTSTKSGPKHTLTTKAVPIFGLNFANDYWHLNGTEKFCDALSRNLSTRLEGILDGGHERFLKAGEIMRFVEEIDEHAGALRWLWFW